MFKLEALSIHYGKIVNKSTQKFSGVITAGFSWVWPPKYSQSNIVRFSRSSFAVRSGFTKYGKNWSRGKLS